MSSGQFIGLHKGFERYPRASLWNALRWLEGCHPTTIHAWNGRARGFVFAPTVGSSSVIQIPFCQWTDSAKRQDEAPITPHAAMHAVEFACAEEPQNII